MSQWPCAPQAEPPAEQPPRLPIGLRESMETTLRLLVVVVQLLYLHPLYWSAMQAPSPLLGFTSANTSASAAWEALKTMFDGCVQVSITHFVFELHCMPQAHVCTFDSECCQLCPSADQAISAVHDLHVGLKLWQKAAGLCTSL